MVYHTSSCKKMDALYCVELSLFGDVAIIGNLQLVNLQHDTGK